MKIWMAGDEYEAPYAVFTDEAKAKRWAQVHHRDVFSMDADSEPDIPSKGSMYYVVVNVSCKRPFVVSCTKIAGYEPGPTTKFTYHRAVQCECWAESAREARKIAIREASAALADGRVDEWNRRLDEENAEHARRQAKREKVMAGVRELMADPDAKRLAEAEANRRMASFREKQLCTCLPVDAEDVMIEWMQEKMRA